jgi:hypothetical protein
VGLELGRIALGELAVEIRVHLGFQLRVAHRTAPFPEAASVS